MADIAQGNRAELILNPGDVYRVSTGGSATVEAVYGAPAGTTTVTASTQDFGPYAANAKLIVRAVSGPASYSINQPIAITGRQNSTGQTVLDDASREVVGNSISIFSPPTSDTSGILVAAYAARMAGGGIVQLPNATIPLSASLPLYSGVKYRGAAKVITYPGIPDGRMFPASGTVLTGNGTFPAFALNETDLGSPLANGAAFSAAGVTDCGISDVVLDGFTFGVKAGALYNPSCWWSYFERIVVLNSTQWGVWFENFQHCVFNDIITVDASVGQQHYGSSGGSSGGLLLNPGNSDMRGIYATISSSKGLQTRGIRFNARGAWVNSLNDINCTSIQCNRTVTGQTTPLSQTANLPASGTDITVSDGSKFVLDLPVVFSSSGSGVYQYQVYFVQYISGNTIRVANTMGGSAISLNAARSTTISSYGFPAIEITGTGAGTMQPCQFGGIDAENMSTALIYMQNAQGITLDANYVMDGRSADCDNTFVARNSTGVIRCHGSKNGKATTDFTNDCSVMYFGDKAVNSTFGNSIAIGPGVWRSTESAATNGVALGSMVISMRKTYGPEMWISNGHAGLHLNSSLSVAQKVLANGNTVNGTGNAVSFVLNAGAGGAVTLPAITAATPDVSNVGLTVMLTNPTANACTVNTSSSQNIIGLGASGTSISIAANSCAILQACNNGGTYYWARYA